MMSKVFCLKIDVDPHAKQTRISTLVPGFAWDKPLLAAVVPDADTGLNLLQLLRLGDRQGHGGGDGDCLCAAVLPAEGQQPTGNSILSLVPLRPVGFFLIVPQDEP